MAAYIEKAVYYPDDEYIKVYFKRWYQDNWKYKYHFLYTKPIGGWTTFEFDEMDRMPYHKFLDTLVVNNTSVVRTKCRLALDIANNQRRFQEIVYALEIVDPTFQACETNVYCIWQNKVIKTISRTTAYDVIETCYTKSRLHRFYDRMVEITR
jgi:hypothetical protein